MPSFFSGLKNALSQEWEGRYLALLLREFGNHDKDAFCRVFGSRGSKAHKDSGSSSEFVTEWAFQGEKKRRADLVQITRKERRLIIPLIVEIKDSDGKKSNALQINDYIQFLHSHQEATFVYLTRFPLHADDAASLRRGQLRVSQSRVIHLTFGDIARRLKTEADSPIAKMLWHYLEDIGVNYSDIDLDESNLKPLRMLARSMTGTSGFGPLVDTVTANSIPEITRQLLGNAQNLGDWLQELSSGWFSQSFRSELSSISMLDLNVLQKRVTRLLKAKRVDCELSELSNSIDGAYIYFISFAKSRGRPSSWITVGYEMVVGKVDSLSAASDDLQMRQFAQVSGSHLGEENYIVERSVINDFPSETEAHKITLRLLKRALQRSIHASSTPELLRDLDETLRDKSSKRR